MGEEVCNATLNFLNGGSMEHSIDSIYIALIPKIKDPYIVNEYRPISLCNL